VEDVQPTYDRIKRQLSKAEGFLMLDLPKKALEILEGRSDWATMQFEASLLTGEALRSLGRFRDALKPLEVAASLHPEDIGVAMALGWCYKRTHRLAQLHYNLSCYWSLAGNAAKSLDKLAAALDLDPDLRAAIAKESDFDALRGNPEFERLTVGPAPLA
jgi:tetratricopeptide (TPR) repeat protein